MKAQIVRIGNSRGIRLPKALLQEAQLEDEVELHAESGRRSPSRPAYTDSVR
jgi:antitoxin MazE